MGRNGGNSWLDVVKKALRSPTKHTKTIKAKRREEHEPEVDQDKKSNKRRWIFKKTALNETTTILHDESNNLSAFETLATKPASRAAYSDEKHAMAVAMATTAAAEAAVATVEAAVEVIRLTSPSFSFRNHDAALVIQTSFRGYLARRALQALKGVVKLQALVRGHNVRRRAKMTLKCMQALVRVQTRVCSQRRKLSNEDSDSTSFWGSHPADNKSIIREESSTNTQEWDRGIEEIQAMLHKTQVAAQKYRGHEDMEENMKRDRKLYMDQRAAVKTVKIDTSSWERRQNQTCYYEQQRLNSNQFSSPLHHQNFHLQSPITPSSLLRINTSVKVQSSSPLCRREERSYMSATASAMARIRPQSAPRQRMSTTEGDKKKTSARKRLSFNGGGVSDTELDCNLRTPIPIHTTERRLSMSSCCKERIEGEISRPSISDERRWFR